MADISLETARRNLDLWVAASEALSQNKSYTIGTRSFTREDAKEVREMITYWRGLIAELDGSGSAGQAFRLATPIG